MRFEGIPYSDYFTVAITWRVEELDEEALLAASTKGTCSKCRVTVTCEVVFLKSTWLSGTIRSNTESELREAVLLWHQRAEQALASGSAGFDSSNDVESADNLLQSRVSRITGDNLENSDSNNRTNKKNSSNNSNSSSSKGAIDTAPSWFTPAPPISSLPLPPSLKPTTLTRADSSQSRLSLASRSDADDSDADFFDVGSFGGGASDSDSVMSYTRGGTGLPASSSSSGPAPLSPPPSLLREHHNGATSFDHPAGIANDSGGPAAGYQFSRPFYPSSLPAHLRYYPGTNQANTSTLGGHAAAGSVGGIRGRDALGRILPHEEGEGMPSSSSPFELAQSLAAALCGVAAVVLQFAWWRLHQDWSVARWAPHFSPSLQTVKQKILGALLPIPWLKCVFKVIKQQHQKQLASCSGHGNASEDLTFPISSSDSSSSGCEISNARNSGRRRGVSADHGDGWARGTDDLSDKAAILPLLSRDSPSTEASNKKNTTNLINGSHSNSDLTIDIENEGYNSVGGSNIGHFDSSNRQRETYFFDDEVYAHEAAEADLFGPLILALTLAQVVLWCVDVEPTSPWLHDLPSAASDSSAGAHESNPAAATARQSAPSQATAPPPSPSSHCERETLLGTSMVVSFSAWGAASLWYDNFIPQALSPYISDFPYYSFP